MDFEDFSYDNTESFSFDMPDLEYERKRRMREQELLRRREEKRRIQEKKRRAFMYTVIGIIAALLIMLTVLGVRGIVRAVNGSHEKDEIAGFELLTEEINDDPDDSGTYETDISSADDTGTDNPSDSGDNDLTDTVNTSSLHLEKPSDFLGKNESLPSSTGSDGSTALINGNIEVYNGYNIHFTSDSEYVISDDMKSNRAILIDGVTGNVICNNDGDKVIYPASMTKIMTVLVAAEHIKEENLDDKVTITIEETDFAYSNDLSAVDFDVGEVVTVRDLFYGTILPSGGDAALALAKYIAGDEESFVKLMNEKVKELGLSNTTHFSNCVGLYSDDNYSTCADIAMILKAAVENDFCFEVLSAHKYTTSSTYQHPDGIEISNWFLRRIEDKDTGGEVLCAKTGFVKESNCCAASFAVNHSGHPYFCVTADAWSSWRAIYDHVYLYHSHI